MHTRLTFTALVAAAILTIDSRLALALQCGYPAPTLLAPADGESDVPVNAKLWFGYYWPERGVTIQLRGPEGPIAVDQRTVMVHSWAAQVVVPRHELRPSTRYEIEMTCANGDCPATRRFTTGVGRAVMVPLPVLLKQTPHAEQRGNYVNRYVHFEFAQEALLVVADFVGQKPVRPDDPESFFEGPWGSGAGRDRGGHVPPSDSDASARRQAPGPLWPGGHRGELLGLDDTGTLHPARRTRVQRGRSAGGGMDPAGRGARRPRGAPPAEHGHSTAH